MKHPARNARICPKGHVLRGAAGVRGTNLYASKGFLGAVGVVGAAIALGVSL